jgi:hypothetical protein
MIDWLGDAAFFGLIAVIAGVFAAVSFYRAISGYRRGRATLSGDFGSLLDSDRKDDPLGFSTAIRVNLVFGAFGLGMAVLIVFGRLL